MLTFVFILGNTEYRSKQWINNPYETGFMPHSKIATSPATATSYQTRCKTLSTPDGPQPTSDRRPSSQRRKRTCTYSPYESLIRRLIRSAFCSYSKIESSALLSTVLQSPRLPSTRPFLDSEIETAIEALKASTSSIDAQTETLKAQCKELQGILEKEDTDARGREDVLERFTGKNVGEAGKVNAQVYYT